LILKNIADIVKQFDYDKIQLIYSLLKNTAIDSIDSNTLLIIEQMSKNSELIPKKLRTKYSRLL